MNIKWDGGVSGHVTVGSNDAAILACPSEVSGFLSTQMSLPTEDICRLGAFCYFLCIREARYAREGSVLADADKLLDSLFPLPNAAYEGAGKLKEQLFSVRSEPGHVIVEHALKHVVSA